MFEVSSPQHLPPQIRPCHAGDFGILKILTDKDRQADAKTIEIKSLIDRTKAKRIEMNRYIDRTCI